MLLPAVVILLGAALTYLWTPKAHTTASVQHFAAGIILAALMLEVFPEIVSHRPSGRILLPVFAIGGLAMFGLKLLGIRIERSTASRPPTHQLNYGFIATVFVDAAFDGLTIGAGFAAGHKVGFALAVGLSVEMLFLAWSLVTETLRGTRMVILASGISATLFTAAVIGYHLLNGASPRTIAVALTFSAAALIYLVTEELLMEAHEAEERSYSMLVLFGGFLTFWAILLI